MSTPTVSVVIPHRNLRPEMLRQAIDSVKEQTFRDWEIIEATGDSLEKFNAGAAKAKGEYLLFLSDDDMLPPDFLEKTVAWIRKDGTGIASTFIENLGGSESGSRHGPGQFPFFTSLIRKDAFDSVGGFDPDMGPVMDVELWWRMGKAGIRWSVCPDAYYVYRRHGDQDSATCDWKGAMSRLRAKHPDYSW